MGIKMEYEIIRSNRKTITVKVDENARVVVRAPLCMTDKEIADIVSRYEKKIADSCEKQSGRAENRQSFALNYGDSVTYLGREFKLTARDGTQAGFDGKCFYFPPELDSEQIRETLIKLYKNLAQMLLNIKVKEYSEKMHAEPAAVKINSASTRWGSCSSKKSINFSWKLVFAEPELVEYVVVHELAHLTEMNHSERFWKKVEAFIPDYKARKKRLDELSLKLANENWN